MLEVEARVLEGRGKVDEGLSDFVDLFVGGDLRSRLEHAMQKSGPVVNWRENNNNSYLYLDLTRVVWEGDRKRHDGFTHVSTEKLR